MFELSNQFSFKAARTTQRTIDAEPSRRIHGHSYRAEVTVRGVPGPATGMVVDLGLFERALEQTRDGHDYRFLDEVEDLGPANTENLSTWIWPRLEPTCAVRARVTIYRYSIGDVCSYLGPLKADNWL